MFPLHLNFHFYTLNSLPIVVFFKEIPTYQNILRRLRNIDYSLWERAPIHVCEMPQNEDEDHKAIQVQ